VLMAAKALPPLDTLKRTGITRVVYASGDYDSALGTMVRYAAMVKAGGISTKFVSLGPIGHVWPDDFEARMREPIAWAAGADNPDEPPSGPR
jgi:hypothetical protein